ncbi:MAG: TolC family protein, partial [Bacteroidota bacterium]
MRLKRMFNIRLAVAVIFSVALSLSVHGQLPDTLTLDFCHERAVEVWPLSIQKNLYEQASDMEMENISKNYLPRFDLNGRATYQSEVTKVEVNMPGVDIPSPDKDMYDLYLGLNQLIWDGGISRNQKILEQADLEISKQQVEVELYQVKSRVNGLFY